MRIDEKLRLIVPLPRPGGDIYLHAEPLSREVFEAHWLVISKAFTVLSAEGLSIVGGPRVAGLAIKTVAKNMGVWDGAEGVERTLIAEMVRLSNIIQRDPNGGGWVTEPMALALRGNTFSEDEKAEVLGIICFFTLNSAMHRKSNFDRIIANMGGLWGTRTTLLGCTEFADSLPTSTAAVNTGATAAAVSVPH